MKGQGAGMHLDEALELACLATHLGDRAAAERWRSEVQSALADETKQGDGEAEEPEEGEA